MAITRTPDKTNKSTQEVQNLSFDTDFNVLAVELLAYDSVGDVLRRVSLDALSHFGTNDIDKASSTTVYEGLEDAEGNWQVVQMVTTGSVTSNRFATLMNNPTVTTYTDAWAARASTLSYGTYSEAF